LPFEFIEPFSHLSNPFFLNLLGYSKLFIVF
jgi:hypothetical protein